MIDLEIKEKQNCTGCYACYNICPKSCLAMNSDNEGFWYPKVDNKNCIQCKKCIKVCPIINKTTVYNEPFSYACYNKDNNIRFESSSGGIFTLVAEEIIKNGGVVFGAGFDGDFNVKHSYVETIEELHRFRGSKYVQSSIGDAYKQSESFLKQGRLVLFSGTPCQIGGLKSYLGTEYSNLFCIDIVCHGVPSPKVWKKYVSFRVNKSGTPIQNITFRLKNKGWKRYSVSFRFKNSREYCETFYKDLFMRAFLKDICLRPSCYQCKFKTLHRQSDITLADFWGIQNIFPEMDDDKGISLIFVNNTKGQIMFEEIKNKIIFKEVDIKQAVKYNPSAIKSADYNSNRNNFFEKLDELPFDVLIKKFCNDGIFERSKNLPKRAAYVMLKKFGILDLCKKIFSNFK